MYGRLEENSTGRSLSFNSIISKFQVAREIFRTWIKSEPIEKLIEGCLFEEVADCISFYGFFSKVSGKGLT